MNKKLLIIAILLISIIFLITAELYSQTDTKILWDKVSKAQQDGLPQTAIDLLKQIYSITSRENRYGEALKALSMQIVFETNIKGNKPEYKVNRMKEEIAKADDKIKPLMKVILAQWYWEYYERNNYRFLNRSQTAGINDEDFTTWDLPKLFNEISSIYQDVLKEDALLKRIKISEYKDFIETGDASELRPTLFDFVAFKALNFYSMAEQATALPQDAFAIDAASDAFAPCEKFINFTPETNDVNSPKYLAIILYQKLLKFHVNDPNPDALIDADLKRLDFVYNQSTYAQDKDKIYIERLTEITKKYNYSKLSSLAYYYWAKIIYDQSNYTEAYKLATFGKKSFPDSYGGILCNGLIISITEKQLSLSNESISPLSTTSTMNITYRNINTVTFRIYKDDWQKYMNERNSISYLDEKEIKNYISKKPIKEWTETLKPGNDYKAKTEKIELPKLEKGLYRIFASYKNDFSGDNNRICYSYLWVSDIAVVTRTHNNTINGFVLNNTSGEPINGATVKAYYYNYDKDKYLLIDTQSTNSNGYFKFTESEKSSYDGVILYATDNKGSEYLYPSEVYTYNSYDERQTQQTVFFTDRRIYRPGQSIQFKGICIDVNKDKGIYKTIPDQKVTIYFKDTNGQEISKLDLITNKYGSFSGTLNAPKDRLMGQMSISTSYPYGNTAINVEEYKRPKFTVEVKPPEKGYRLNEDISITGEAVSYTGAKIDGATVAYRVVRQARMPFWWNCYWGYYKKINNESQEIANGSVKTDVDGKFTIIFNAKPDKTISEKEEPTFIYTIYADVTDTTGETISAEQAIRVGYTAIEATITGDDYITSNTPAKFNINTTTLDGKPVACDGTVEIVELNGPAKPVREELQNDYYYYDEESFNIEKGNLDTSNWQLWPEGKTVEKTKFKTDKTGLTSIATRLNEGTYKAILETKDEYGKKVTAMLPIIVTNPGSNKFSIKVPSFYMPKSQTVEVGDKFQALWGTGYDSGRAFIEIYRNGKCLNSYWTENPNTQSLIEVPVTEDYRGGFTVRATYVRENRLYSYNTTVNVPWSNKDLKLKFETFRSKLYPGQKEKWTLKIKGPDAQLKAAELVATLYDESLDSLMPFNWPGFSSFFRYENLNINEQFSNNNLNFNNWVDDWYISGPTASLTYPHFPSMIDDSYYGYNYPQCEKSMTYSATPGVPKGGEENRMMTDGVVTEGENKDKKNGGKDEDTKQQNKPTVKIGDVNNANVRKNLNETAFFFPHLTCDKNGTVNISFQMPEALTKWRFLSFAHTPDMENGFLEEHIVTQKDLMVQPNPPRFLREGDSIEFTVKVTNMTDKEAKGTVTLNFFDPRDEKLLDKELQNSNNIKTFKIGAKESRSFSWLINVPTGLELVAFKTLGTTDKHTDGEEGVMPVLSSRIFVTESIPLWVRGPGEKKFEFKKLINSKDSKTLENKRYVVQMTSNPSWYAVQALPFLMEFPHECSEQTFNRLYANLLAKTIADSDPKIRKIFDEWKGTDALKSNLEKNEDLKSVMLLDTPWVIDAKNETDAKHNVGILFDDKRMKNEIDSAYNKLANMQLSDGSWPWFPGGEGDTFMTLYIMTGFGRLKHLNVQNVDYSPAIKSLDHLDRWINDEYLEILKYKTQNENNLSSTIALYLYGRSFFLKEKPIPPQSKKAVDYFLKQGEKYWLKLDNRMSQGHLALALNRFGDKETPKKIMASIKERSENSEELGMFWSENELSWWWYRAPIETQAVMIEAFDEVTNDQKAVEDCKVWLLKQKQTTDWKTTKATSDSIYALLCKGENLLASDEIVSVTVGTETIKPDKTEAGTGFYEKIYKPTDIKPDMGEITVKKNDPGISWGGAYWQYIEDMSKITPSVQGPLKLKKTLFVQKYTSKGPVIEPVNNALSVGDLVIVRIELRTDRDMEYVHMKDQRGSGFEPINVISNYKYQDGLRYYESTKDTATHFYIDYLPKGTYVFEYQIRVVNKGKYQTGISEIQCMYAPEFSSHSESFWVEVK